MTDPADLETTRTHLMRPAAQSARPEQNRLPVLVVLRGAQVGRRYLLNEASLTLGRRPDRAQLVVLGDPLISSLHCRVDRDAGTDAWTIVDLGSTNGTEIRGERVSSAPIRDGDRIHIGDTVLKFCFHDELEEAFHRQVDHLMNVDDLTGLPVQRVYRQRFDEALQRQALRRAPLAVFMLDLDGLKRINDTYGHLVGSRTIATVGRRLGDIVEAARGTVSRFGGDEFSAFVPDLDPAAAAALGERMRAAVADEAVVTPTASVQPTISIGVSMYPAAGGTAEALTRCADEALYRAKADGRNCVRG